MGIRKTRILGIVPYKTMKPAMEKLAEKRDDITLEIYVGDLKEGVDIVRNLRIENYDVIISRGGTAQLIEQNTTIPVIEINISVYDIMRAIKLADNYRGKYAIVGFKSITKSASLLCDLLQYHVPIYTIQNSEEAQSLLKKLKEEGFQLVLCDMVTNNTARNLEMNAILITSGSESIQDAFAQAVKTHRMIFQLEEKQMLLDSLLQHPRVHTAVFQLDGTLSYCSADIHYNTELLDILSNECPSAASCDDYKFFTSHNDMLYSVESKKLHINHQQYIAFYLTGNHISALKTKHGISFRNLKDVETTLFDSFYGIIPLSKELESLISSYAESSYPVMILGEHGTRKKFFAGLIYTQSIMSNHPYVLIDCARINDKEWNFLINHYNSPLNDKENTLFFNNINNLPEENLQKLLSIILEQKLHKNNRLIFSCSTTPRTALPYIINKFTNDLSCLVLNTPPLRENIADIPTFSCLYLNSLNVALSKQIIGFQPDAMDLLQQYPWPNNYTQFKRVLRELAVLTETPYIQASQVEQILSIEVYCNTIEPPVSSPAFSPSGSLEEITQSIIRRTVDEMGGNQSAAAKKLQISRTTLWRYLKQPPE